MAVNMANFVVKFSDKLVHQYLIEIGCSETAEEFRKVRRGCTVYPIDLNGDMTISELLSRIISKHRDKFANTVFLNHLRNHPKPGVQNLALKLQKELTKQKELFQLEGNIPSVEEVFKHYVTPIKDSVPVEKKTSKEEPNQLKDKIANTVVYEYLKKHEKPGVRQLALELHNGSEEEIKPFATKLQI